MQKMGKYKNECTTGWLVATAEKKTMANKYAFALPSLPFPFLFPFSISPLPHNRLPSLHFLSPSLPFQPTPFNNQQRSDR